MSPFVSLFIPEVTSQDNNNSLQEQLKLPALARNGLKTKFKTLDCVHINKNTGLGSIIAQFYLRQKS
jgi:hypothetical protein